MAHPDLDRERSHLDGARRALEAMARRTESALGGVESAATEADAEVARWHLERRLSTLRLGDELAAFGRIDDDAGERWYVGRRHIEDGEANALVVDWRAPVSVPFYRATVHDPLGLDRRRRFTGDGAELTDILEEDFTDPDSAGLAGGIPDPLLAELDRERTGSMRDIVATIAAEQDEVIRSPLDGLLVVQGGPGTGKTAVALHRAAYLLFEHRMELLDTGVLVIGPNPLFLRYVADVLPSLGEAAVRQTTVDGLRPPSIRLGDPDDAATGRLKGDERMAAVIRAVVVDHLRRPTETVELPTPWGTVRLDPDTVSRVVDDVLARGVTHATGKESVRNQLLHEAYAVHERVAEVPALKANFVAEARRAESFRKFLDGLWPVPSAPAVVRRLLSNAAARTRAGAGVLDADELDRLARPVAKKVIDERWTPAEIPLLDEAEAVLNGVRASYGHIVVDEAQDLSAMALRMLARRSTAGSMTVVGDLAQATQPWGQTSWDAVAATLAGTGTVRRAELTVGYRTPAPILDLANRLLPVAAPDVTPARSIRSVGVAPRFVPVDVVSRDRSDVDDELAAAVTEVAAELLAGKGTTAVIAAEQAHEVLGRACTDAGLGFSTGAGARLGSEDDRILVVTPLLAKGLEFDAVVVVEPADIVDGPAGHRNLFVALTRPTTTLVVVHSRPLPNELAHAQPG